MTDQILILGGQGRIGSSVAQDLITHTQAEITVTGRQENNIEPQSRMRFLALDLADTEELRLAIASHNLVIHCAGP
ncbi:MAG: saccharopine dehydrogenase NADP-binding domain-containing protein, partial [Coleofasciculaceae cyanobacterium]